ncbi:MAG: hypothetical protein M3Y06_03305, partial [Actinomycetota bacterium]|nr:hypothetical protein [Actinomycetota bacterium]
MTTSPGSQTSPRTRPANYADGSPIGQSVDLYATSGGVRTRGWAFDPDSPSTALRVFSTVDGKYQNAATASVPRVDAARAYPGAGAAHGYDLMIPVPEGLHRVCVLAHNLQRGKDITLACTSRVFDYGPIGALDRLDTRPGALHVLGWTLDPDQITVPLTIQINVDGVTTTTVADRSRPDVANAHKGAGSAHGFDVTIPAAQGGHTVCVIEKNVGYGTDNSLGCHVVTLNDNPLGYLDLAAQQSGKLHVRGWTFDRDQPTSPLTISITVDSGAPRRYTANSVRADVAKAYPGAGPNHGYDQLITSGEGTHRVCVTAHNIGYGADRVLSSCRTATLDFTPTASLTSLTATSTGVSFGGWATDPDTSKPISVRVTL